MVRKRVKRKTAASSSSNSIGIGQNIEKSVAQVENKSLTNVATVTTDQEVSHDDLDKFLKGHVHHISNDPASGEKITMV